MGHLAAAHWGHDSSITFFNYRTKKVHVLELEKVTGIKHYRGHQRRKRCVEDLHKCLKIAEEQFGIENDFDVFILGIPNPIDGYYKKHDEINDMIRAEFDTCLWPSHVKRVFNVKRLDFAYRHHMCHALSAYGQSSFKNSVILTHDGVGDDGRGGLFLVEDGKITSVFKAWTKAMFPFTSNYNFACIICMYDIVKNTKCILDVAGKTMGASAYGRKDSEYYKIGRTVYETMDATEINPGYRLTMDIYRSKTSEQLEKFGITGFNNGSDYFKDKHYDENNPEHYNIFAKEYEKPKHITWQHQCDMALGIQRGMMSKVYNFVNEINPLIRKYDRNLIISGGGGLNVLVNRVLQDEFRDMNIWVPPNPSDVGLSYGMLVQYMIDNEIDGWRQDITYNCPDIFDKKDFNTYLRQKKGKKVDVKTISKLLKSDKIIGLIQGNGEVGPRALGNRSILADPKGHDKKDKVNIVKKREPYRPFAPVCRLEDAKKYFDTKRCFNLFHMNFAVKTKKEYKEQLAAVTHVDDTARLQVVTKKSNNLLYDILTEFDGVLLNTSFNVQGKPILNTYEEAFHVLETTELDAVVIKHDGYLYLFES